ncbi:MAG TPA: hypothetical protein VFU13_19970 [Steroidobacteraceae bacterium]|nr:hypothetical protein [Steroidobacteraceae bacterium]
MIDPRIQAVFDRWAAQEMVTRGNIVHTVAMFTADSVPGPLNKPVVSWKIRAWRRRALIFGARYKGRDYFPAFQFRLGEPKPIVQQILCLVKPSDDWHAMFWFVGTNVWLDGIASPYEVMDLDPDQVLEAASHANDQVSD